MSVAAVTNTRSQEPNHVLSRLRSVCDAHGLGDLSAHLEDLSALVAWDMRDMEQALATLPNGESLVHKSAHHLVAQGGKRLRPMCVALAARIGSGFNQAAKQMGIAVELVHCATLLHDDVVDVGDQRRGAAAARLLYGNAASIFAGDWLLVEALRQVGRVRVDGVLERLLDIIEEMILAESIQLEQRGKVHTQRETYFQVVDGKTAALFRWAMYAGGKAGGLADADCKQLEKYGHHLGMAFQLVDDLLDYAGDAAITGKELFADLREGKMTYPLIIALERDPSLRATLEDMVATPSEQPIAAHARMRLINAFHDTDALSACRQLAHQHAEDAIAALQAIHKNADSDSDNKDNKSDDNSDSARAIQALITVARATVHREA